MADGALLGKLTTLRAIVLVSKVLPEIRHIYDFAFLEVPIGRSRDGDWVRICARSYSLFSA